jgi:CHAT domain-containing protein
VAKVGTSGFVVGLAVLGSALLAAVAVPSRFWTPRDRPTDRPELRQLFAALAEAPSRVVEGRLAGGFPYAPPAVLTRGTARRLPPEVVIAAATIEAETRAADLPQARAALGVAHLVLGEWDRGIEALEDAIAGEPGNAVFHNDLSVAYLARAASLDRAEDWARALASANRALARDARRVEAHFNRALALSGLRMSSTAIDAWTGYRALDPVSRWSDESRARVDAIQRLHARTMQTGGESSDHQSLRERIEDRLLGEWGEAVERGDDVEAERMLAEAESLAARLAGEGGDAMARDQIRRIRALQRQADADAVRAFASGHRLYGESRAHWLASRWTDADASMAQASAEFRRVESDYAVWTRVFRGILLQTQGQGDAALRELQAIVLPPRAQHYFHLRGRVAWVEGFLLASQGRFDLARPLFLRAVEEFTDAAEPDYLAAAHINLAEAEWYLGSPGGAWTNLAVAFSLLDVPGDVRRTDHLDVAASIALDEGLPEAALEFRNTMVRLARTPPQQAQGFLRRARTLIRLNRIDDAAADLERASATMATWSEPVWRERTRTDIAIVSAELYGASDCPRAIRQADVALALLAGSTGTIRRGALLTLRAKCREAVADLPGARADLDAAARVFEERRATLSSAADRVQAFGLERDAYRTLLAMQVVKLADADGGLATAERARAGILGDGWPARGALRASHASLPPGVAVIYFESLPEHVLVWVLTRDRAQSFTRPVSDVTLRQWVGRIRRAIDRGASAAALRPEARAFTDSLLAPALEIAARAASGPPTLVFVPDGPLFAMPFAALPDAQGRPLIDRHLVAVAPSLTALLAASAELATAAPADLLAVGDAHDPALSGLPKLPHADAEAQEVARLYPASAVLTGSRATKQRFLSQAASVIHFAGHSVLNERFPMFSRMLLAPEPATGDGGWLLASEVTPEHFRDTRVVVLATCEGAAGKAVEGEGAVSMARAFFSAGVPAVVASLWPVDDDLQTLMTAFHRELRAGQDPARALQAGQHAILAERGRDTPVRVWGGFMMLGGLAPAAAQGGD